MNIYFTTAPRATRESGRKGRFRRVIDRPRGQRNQVHSTKSTPRTDTSTLVLRAHQVHRVLSSDKIANIDESLVRLELHLDQPSSESRRQVSLELSREELERVISELDNAKKALDQLKEK